MAKVKKSVSLEPRFVRLIEMHDGDGFTDKLETLLTKYAAMVKANERSVNIETDLGNLNEHASAAQIDSMFENEKQIFSKLSEQNNARFAFDLLTRPEDNTTATGFAPSQMELLIERVNAISEALSSVKSHLKLVTEVEKVNNTPETFMTRLIVAMQTKNNDLAAALMEQLEP